MRIAGLFAGIGGLELPFRQAGHSTALLCDSWEPSQKVLAARFPDIPLVGDVAQVAELPEDVELVTAGFPCTDLSQAGRTAGIRGVQSGLVSNVFRLLESAGADWLVLENVRNMLVLERGEAMNYLVSRLEDLGFTWAYRLVDSRFTGVPQRRHRVIFVASRGDGDPREVIFSDDAGEDTSVYGDEAYGFYWTEGLRGLGWAQDAVPPLKGGSTVGIPSPPGVWLPNAESGRKLVMPSTADAEQLQGFPRGWTEPAQTKGKNGPRWKLIGNAVTVGVTDWLVSRFDDPGSFEPSEPPRRLKSGERWPNAAWGREGEAWTVEVSTWPQVRPYQPLASVIDIENAAALSHRAIGGFLNRVARSTLRFDETFLRDCKEHLELTRTAT